MAELTSQQRKALPASDFVFPAKAPGPGSYPIPDEAHARAALARVEEFGTPYERHRVYSAVERKFPDMEIEEKE